MNQTLRSLGLLVVGFALCLAAGCGSPSALELCHDNCDNEKKCGRDSDTDYQNCNTSCNNNAGNLMQSDQDLAKNCTNAGDLRKQQAACFGNTDACNQVALASCNLTILGNCVKP